MEEREAREKEKDRDSVQWTVGMDGREVEW